MWKKYTTIKEAAEFLGVSVSTIRNWDRTGKLTAERNPTNRYRLYYFPKLADFAKSISKGNKKIQLVKD